MSSNVKPKFVGEVKTFAIDWRKQLRNANNGSPDTIATAVWTIGGNDNALLKDAQSRDGDVTYIQTSAGTAGQQYTLQCQVTLTTSADTPPLTMIVNVKADPV